jgi:hypothetical protein
VLNPTGENALLIINIVAALGPSGIYSIFAPKAGFGTYITSVDMIKWAKTVSRYCPISSLVGFCFLKFFGK